MGNQLLKKLKYLNVDFNKKKNDVELLKDFSLLLSRSHSLTEAMLILESRYEIGVLREKMLSGNSFSQSLQELNYSSDIRLIIRINENNGQLLNGINEAIMMINIKNSNHKQLMKQIRYPLFLIIVIILVIMFINNFVLPQILGLYDSFNVKLPLMIKIFIMILNVIPTVVALSLVMMAGFMFSFNLLSFESKLKYLSRIPIIGKEYKKMYNILFMNYIMNLLKSKITLAKALEILSEQNEHKLLKKEALRLKKELDEGEMFINTLSESLYLKSTIEIFKIGIKQDNLVMCLESHLIKVKENQEVKNQRILFLIQPLIYLIIGFIIVIVYGLIFNICYGLIS